jgi:hypothetical protein
MKSMVTLIALMIAAVAHINLAHATQVNEWRFAVSLDDKPIGYHRFALNEREQSRELISEARFDVKFLFINAYRYAHEAREVWQGDCLLQLDARTDDNGERIAVRGARDADGFIVSAPRQSDEMSDCVQTFAYWNPTILSATQLLNPQTGEYVPVAISRLGRETLTVRGQPIEADRYRIVGDSKTGVRMQIDLWYSPNREWLGLESLAEGGRRLRYRIQ